MAYGVRIRIPLYLGISWKDEKIERKPYNPEISPFRLKTLQAHSDNGI